METPSSTMRRVTRSQTRSALKNSAVANHLLSSKKPDDSSVDKCESKSRPRNGLALFDITNDSPIVGVAMQTPSSGVVRKRNMSRIKKTPGSGEALLRGQVKTLLQKVEEEADITRLPMESRRPFTNIIRSPMGLLAPTPANTPQVLDFPNGKDQVKIVITPPVIAEKEDSLELEKSPSVTRSLMLDFSDKSESSDCSSVVTRSTDDGSSSSVWSMQVNVSTKDEEKEDQVYSYTEDNDEFYDEEEEEGGNVDGLCEVMRKMSVQNVFTGKHTHFVYDSEDEEIVDVKEQLKGFTTPTPKHVRFTDDDEDE